MFPKKQKIAYFKAVYRRTAAFTPFLSAALCALLLWRTFSLISEPHEEWMSPVAAGFDVSSPVDKDNSTHGQEIAIYEELDAVMPEVSAECAALYLPQNGKLLCSKNADARRPMASTTKIMTALLALENRTMDHIVTVDSSAVGITGTSVYLKAGERVTEETLLYAMMLESANDAAAAIACDIGGSIGEFAVMMNEKAAVLGLEGTHFKNPHGLADDEHYTTAEDLARLTAAAMENEDFRRIVSTERATFTVGSDETLRLFVNHNRLLRQRDDIIGVKTGFTKASGRCLVSAADRGGLTLIAVTLNAPDDWNDHEKLLDAGFDVCEMVTLAEAGELEFTIPVAGGNANTALCVNVGEVSVIRRRGGEELNRVTELPRFVYAPVRCGDVLGQIVWYDGEVEVCRAELRAETAVDAAGEKKSLWQKLFGK